jgi:chromosome segregation ATPase
MAAEHVAVVDDLREQTAQQIADLAREHGAAMELACAQERAEATLRGEATLEQRIAELKTHLLAEAEAAEAERRTAREAELRDWTAQREAEQKTLAARIADLEKLVARGREALDAERRDRLREEFETTLHSDALEARLETGKERVEALEKELAAVRDEVPALEDEIAALRAELTSVRSSMDSESTLLRVANVQLEGNRRLLDRAKQALAELVAEGEKAAGS